jgi:hypothetical protein
LVGAEVLFERDFEIGFEEVFVAGGRVRKGKRKGMGGGDGKGRGKGTQSCRHLARGR